MAAKTGAIRAVQSGHMEEVVQRGLPIVSVDTKKKESVGRFKNSGVAWSRRPLMVNDRDFVS